MTYETSPNANLRRGVCGLYLLTLLGIAVAAFAASVESTVSVTGAVLWMLQAGVFLGVLRALREVALELMTEADHE